MEFDAPSPPSAAHALLTYTVTCVQLMGNLPRHRIILKKIFMTYIIKVLVGAMVRVCWAEVTQCSVRLEFVYI